jgi:hypothetical protein
MSSSRIKDAQEFVAHYGRGLQAFREAIANEPLARSMLEKFKKNYPHLRTFLETGSDP